MPQSPSNSIRDPDSRLSHASDGSQLIELTGAWDIRALPSRAASLNRGLARLARGEPARWDLTQVQRLNHVGALLIWRAWSKERPKMLALNPAHQMFFANLEGTGTPISPAWRIDFLAPVRSLGAALLTNRLRQRLSGASSAGVVVPADAIRTEAALRVELDDFAQVFDAVDRSRALVRVRATLVGNRIGILQRALSVEKAVVSADAEGGVRSLAAASDEVIEQLLEWLAAQLKG